MIDGGSAHKVHPRRSGPAHQDSLPRDILQLNFGLGQLRLQLVDAGLGDRGSQNEY